MPINFHIGNMGVASSYPDTVDSVPPAIHGGNVDDRRIGKGATMYYPVQARPPVHGVVISCFQPPHRQGRYQVLPLAGAPLQPTPGRPLRACVKRPKA